MSGFPIVDLDREVRRLNLLWHAVLPGAIVTVMLALYGLVASGSYRITAAVAVLSEYLPYVVVALFLFGILLAGFIKARLPLLVANGIAESPGPRVTAAMFTLLGAVDAPAVIGLGLYMLTPVDWLAATVVLYAFAAGVFFKPDFRALLQVAQIQKAARHD